MTTGEVDLEALEQRLDALEDPDVRECASKVARVAIDVGVKLQQIDFAALERHVPENTPHQLWSSAEEPVSAMWEVLEELQEILRPLADSYDQAHDEESGLELFGDQPQPAKEPVGVLGRIAETAWTMSFVLSGEVAGFRKRLPQVLRLEDAWELADAIQEHLAHVQSGVGAILSGVFASLPNAGEQTADGENLEIMTARELRARVFELRDQVLELEQQMRDSSPGEWQPLLNRIQGLLKAFAFGPGFAWMRSADKRSFLNQHTRLNDILELWSPLRADPARQAVDNLARFLEALEMLNQRECLVAHDRAALCTVVKQLERATAEGGPDARRAIGAGVAALSEAQGRDKQLDTLLAQTLEPGNEIPVDAILERARELLARLGG